MDRRGKKDGEASRRSMEIKTALDIPEALSPSLPHIEAEGNREVSVEGCKGIVEYGRDFIKLNAGALVLAFRGEDLEIKVFSDIQTVITGDISCVEFEK